MVSGRNTSLFDVESVPQNYVFSEAERPGKKVIPICQQIPVIDLQADSQTAVTQILEAAQDFGFFQVINHGVSKDIISDAVGVVNEFMGMGEDEKKNTAGNYVYTSSGDFAKDGVHLWRENIKHTCLHPALQDCMQFGPHKPPTYREAIGKYLVEMRKLSTRILEMIGEGMGVEGGYFEKMSEVQLLSANHYPPCPDPSLTLGLLRHTDPSLITILFQGQVCGLQVFKDAQWIAVAAIPNAFLVNIGNQLEIISNGKLKSAEHRVTNTEERRTSIATFVNPHLDFIVEPAKTLINELNPPRFESRRFKDFVQTNNAFGPQTNIYLEEASRTN